MPAPRHRLVPLPCRSDRQGVLSFAQEGDQVPFQIRRVFFIYHVVSGGCRGGHAHHSQHQFLLMMGGACTVTVDDGYERVAVELSQGADALYVPPMLWLDLTEFTEDAVCCGLASGVYQESDYIRDRNAFLMLARQ